jgi:hypothetical protein
MNINKVGNLRKKNKKEKRETIEIMDERN